MAETKKLSMSFRVDNGVLEHNNRSFVPKNVDASRTSDNITYISEDLREVYHRLFDDALQKYNEKKRSNEKIPDYYEHIRKGKQENLFTEAVVQFGDMESCGLNSGNWEIAKQMLDEYMQSFQARNPNMIVFAAHLHLDEGTPHLHIDFVPVCHNQTRGLSTRVSLKRALAEQGVTAQSRKKSEWAVWKDVEFAYMTELLRKYGFERDVKNDTHRYLPVDEYKKAAAQRAEIKQVNAHINELKKKNATELTAADFEQINNQNDYMRKTVAEYQGEIAELTKKLNSPFVPLEIFSEDKLQFVVAELTNRGIPFVEENTTLHIPEYAKEQADAIAASYQKKQTLGIREHLKLDIDRIVYSASSFEDFLKLLKDIKYEVKTGKYIAVKPPYAKRFIRLKTLGEDYLQHSLEERIANRNKFANSVRRKYETAQDISRPFYAEIINLTEAVRLFKVKPKKTKPESIYIFQNDENINYLSAQLRTITEFGFSSREQIYAKAEELQERVNNGDSDEEITGQLARVRELITAYETVIEGDYIGNLIRAQQERIEAEKRAVEQRKAAQTKTTTTIENSKKHHR